LCGNTVLLVSENQVMRSSGLLFKNTWRALPRQGNRLRCPAIAIVQLTSVEYPSARSTRSFQSPPCHPARAKPNPFAQPITPVPTFTQSPSPRTFSTWRILQQSKLSPAKNDTEIPPKKFDDDLDPEDEERGFGRSEKATQAAQVNLSARLGKDGKSQGKTAGVGEIWRLIKIARPEAGILGGAFILLLVSSAITMSVPFSIGRILDQATNPESGNVIFGVEPTTFYMALGGILAIGAAANYGRIIILRIVGERIVARLRSQLFRRTFIQNAEFFDANRVGDLISRLSSDTIIVGKSITQNLSDGLRALVSGGAAFGLMAWVSLKLSGVLALMFPPVALGAFFFGNAIRNLSRKIQRNLGTLTKIAEERLGNVRTSQSFAGESLEVGRYNKQVKKIFALGKREALISATFFSTVSISFQGKSQH
jgi:putative ABC transport system ATP-binding protein